MKQSRKQQIKENTKGRRRGNGGRGRKQPDRNWATEPIPSPKRARQLGATNARAEYGPTIRAAKADIRGSRAHEQQIGQGFDQLGTNINQAAAQTDASYAQANDSVRANIEAAQKAALANQTQIAGGNVDFAALTGADPSTFAQGTQEAANAAGQRSLTQSMLAAPIAQAGASQAAHLRNVGLNSRREGIHQRGLESKRRQEIKADLTALRKERAQKATANFMDIRQGERDYSVQRQAFNLDKRGQSLDAASEKADRDQRWDENEADNAQDEAASIRGAKNDGRGGLTPSQRRGARREQKSANVAARNLYTASWPAKKKPQTASEWAVFTQLIAAEEGIDPVAAKKAVKKLRRSLRGAG